MNFGNTFSTALKAIFANKRRSFLTMLGVIIGVGSVVLLTSIGTGLQYYISEQFNSLGSNVLYVVPGKPFSNSGDQEAAFLESTKPTLKSSDLDLIMRNHRDLFEAGAASGFSRAEAKYGTIAKRVTLYGITADYPKVTNTKAEKGNWFSASDEQRSKKVVLLGPQIANELFGKIDPVNKQVKIEGQGYTVVGVLEKKGGGLGGPSFDGYVYLPLQTLFDNLNVSLIDNLAFKMRRKEDLPAAKVAIETDLKKRLDADEFSVIDQTELLNTINQILGVLTIGLGGIAAISLVVGGIGIMNIMLVSVTERTREIGLRKAIGATPKVILVQFLIEAALLSGIGGCIGIALAFIGTSLIQIVFPARILPESIALAFGVSTAVGLIFGAAPARSASKLSPIEALRSE